MLNDRENAILARAPAHVRAYLERVEEVIVDPMLRGEPLWSDSFLGRWWVRELDRFTPEEIELVLEFAAARGERFAEMMRLKVVS